MQKMDWRVLVQQLPRPRRDHSMAVGRAAERIANVLPADQRADFVTAAYLHDIGYAQKSFGFHPIDGARYLATKGYSKLVLYLVANHTAARIEAQVRGLDPALFDEFAYDDADAQAASDLLWWADLTTGPTGETVTPAERLAEIRVRYGPDHIVTTAINRAEPLLLAAVHRAEGSM